MTEKLAIMGGQRAVPADIIEYIKHPDISEKHLEMLRKVCIEGDLSFPINNGVIKQLEEQLKAYLDCRYILASNNGTSALFSAFFGIAEELSCPTALQGKEIICPTYTWWATIAPAVNQEAIPVFVDICPNTLAMLPSEIEKNITSRTVALVVPHLFGTCSDMDAIIRIAREHHLKIIEDASHAFGAKWDGHFLGTLGDVGCFSLQAQKPLAAGEGGFLATNDDDLYHRALTLGHYERLKGIKTDYQRFMKTGLGFKFRISTLNAALALASLHNFAERSIKENQLNEALCKNLDRITGLRVINQNDYRFERGGLFQLRIHVDFSCLRTDYETLVDALLAEGVPIEKEYYTLLHLEPFFAEKSINTGKGCLLNAENTFPGLIALKPLRYKTPSNYIELIIAGFNKVFDHFRK